MNTTESDDDDVLKIKMNVGKCSTEFSMHFDDKYESDVNIKKALTSRTLYEHELSVLFTKILRHGDAVVDIGANVGWFTILSSKLVGPNGIVRAVEPAPSNVAKLKANVSLNNLTNVLLLEGAVSDKTGTTKLFINPHGNGGHALWDMQAGKNTEQSTAVDVNTYTVDNITSDISHIRILKIDTEGHEQRVLSGATSLLKRGGVDFVFAEWHSPGLRAFGDSQNGIRRLMSGFGYYTFLLIQNSWVSINMPEDISFTSPHIQNLVFVRPDHFNYLDPSIKFVVDRPKKRWWRIGKCK